MKRLISLAAAIILIALSAVSVWAATVDYTDEDYGYTISLPEDYTTINRTNLSSNAEFIERLGYSVKSFRLRMEESNILLYAADKDNRHQIQLKVWESDFSKEVEQLSTANDEQLSEMLYVMSGQLELEDGRLTDSRVTDVAGQKYLTYTVEVADAFTFVQNVTVVNGKCYALVYYNSSPQLSAEEQSAQQALLNSLKIKKVSTKAEGGGYYLVIRIICAAVAIVAIVVAVLLISSFVKDIKRRKEQPEIIPDRIKMRRK